MTIGFTLALLSTLSVSAAPVNSQTDEDKLVEKITKDVIKQLRNNSFLEKEIDTGIIRFLKKQQEAQARAPDKKAKNVRPVSMKGDHIYGNPDAEVSLIEYSNFVGYQNGSHMYEIGALSLKDIKPLFRRSTTSCKKPLLIYSQIQDFQTTSDI